MGDKASSANATKFAGPCRDKLHRGTSLRFLFLYTLVRNNVIGDPSLKSIHLTHYLEITCGRRDQSVITVDAGKTIHDSLLPFTGSAVPQAHPVSKLMGHEPLQRMWAGGGKIEVNPG